MDYFDSLQEEIHSIFCARTAELSALIPAIAPSNWFLGVPSSQSKPNPHGSSQALIGFPHDRLVLRPFAEAHEAYAAIPSLAQLLDPNEWKCVAQVCVTHEQVTAAIVGRVGDKTPWTGQLLDFGRTPDSGWALISVQQAGAPAQLIV